MDLKKLIKYNQIKKLLNEQILSIKSSAFDAFV